MFVFVNKSLVKLSQNVTIFFRRFKIFEQPLQVIALAAVSKEALVI